MANTTQIPLLTWPESICIRLTRACNARCPFCQAPDLSDDLTLSIRDIERILPLLSANGVKSIKLSGGEPTIRNDLPEIVDIVHASGMIPTVTSNGLRVSGQLISAMARAKGKIKFSVHYPDERNDGIIRPKSFELIRRNARRIVEAGVPFGINCVVSKDNYPAMTSMAKLSEDWGAKKITFFPVISRGLAKRNEYETEMTLSFRKDVCCFSMVISDMFPNLRVRCIDLNTDEYWIVDHDGRFFISKGEEFDDTIIFNNSSWFR